MPLKSLTLANHPNKNPNTPTDGPQNKDSAEAPAVGLCYLLRSHRQRGGRVDLIDCQKKMRTRRTSPLITGLSSITNNPSKRGVAVGVTDGSRPNSDRATCRIRRQRPSNTALKRNASSHSYRPLERGAAAPAAGWFISDEKGHAFAGAALRGSRLCLTTRREAPCEGEGWREREGRRARPAAPLAVGYAARDRPNMGRGPIPRRNAARRASSRPQPHSTEPTSSSEGRSSAPIITDPKWPRA